MKSILLAAVLLIPLGLFCYTVPVSWFNADLGMSKSEVYELCGPPASTDLWDIKGERWDSIGPLWYWTMYVDFDNEVAAQTYIWLNIGTGPIEVRVYIMDDGEWTLFI